VPDVAHLAARVLFNAQLTNANALAGDGQMAVDADDRRALEPRGDAAVQVLLPRDVELADDARVEEQGDLDRNVDGLSVDGERRGVVDVVRARCLALDAVDDVLLGWAS
jgi:hypothetical protein